MAKKDKIQDLDKEERGGGGKFLTVLIIFLIVLIWLAILALLISILSIVGIPALGQHSLRHTFATRCIESGVPAVVLKTWLGHTDIHITLDTYTDVFEQLDQSAVNTLDDYLEAI